MTVYTELSIKDNGFRHRSHVLFCMWNTFVDDISWAIAFLHYTTRNREVENFYEVY